VLQQPTNATNKILCNQRQQLLWGVVVAGLKKLLLGIDVADFTSISICAGFPTPATIVYVYC